MRLFICFISITNIIENIFHSFIISFIVERIVKELNFIWPSKKVLSKTCGPYCSSLQNNSELKTKNVVDSVDVFLDIFIQIM